MLVRRGMRGDMRWWIEQDYRNEEIELKLNLLIEPYFGPFRLKIFQHDGQETEKNLSIFIFFIYFFSNS